MSFYGAFECAVSKRRSVICDRLALSAKEPKSDDDSDLVFDIWKFTNDIMDNKNVSGSAR